MANFSICFNNTQGFRQINIGGPWYLWHSLWFSFGFLPLGVRLLLVRQDLHEEAKGQVHPLSVTDPSAVPGVGEGVARCSQLSRGHVLSGYQLSSPNVCVYGIK